MTARKKIITAREAALKTLQDLEGGAFLDELLDRHGRSLDARDRGLTNALVLGVLRHRTELDWIVENFLRKPGQPLDPRVRDILRLGLFQLNHLDRIPASAAVNESVNLAKKFGPARSPALVNGILRNIIRTKRQPDPDKADLPPVRKLALTTSHPEWMVSLMVKQLGFNEAAALLQANNQAAPLSLQINTLKTTRAELTALLEKNQGCRVNSSPYSPTGLLIDGPAGPIPDLPGYNEGLFMIQDQAGQLVSRLARPEKGQDLLDACAGLGGKALSVLCLGSATPIWALDPDRARLARIRPETRRLGFPDINIVQGSLLAGPFKSGRFDIVLVDAPCSNLGVIRRRPDVKWLKTEKHIKDLAGRQSRLLDAASRLTATGGRLIYSVCTFTAQETREIIQKFLSNHPDFRAVSAADYLPPSARRLVADDGFLETWPHRHGVDGFFAAVLHKPATV